MSSWEAPPVEYQYAFPDEILFQLAELTLDAIKSCDFRIAMPQVLSAKKDDVFCTLNRAWEVFWASSPDEFRDWESKTLQALKQKYGREEQLA
jgi:hypothetical protein